MKRIIYYNQIIPEYDYANGNIISEKKIFLTVESDNDHDFNEQLETVKGYCDDWRVEEIEE